MKQKVDSFYASANYFAILKQSSQAQRIVEVHTVFKCGREKQGNSVYSLVWQMTIKEEMISAWKLLCIRMAENFIPLYVKRY